MTYYGSTYKGNIDIYDIHELQAHECSYDALKEANDAWNSDPENHAKRLLIIIRQSESKDEIISDDKAYFQFNDSNSCNEFIKKQEAIIWSNSRNQVWNGNAQMMGKRM